MREIKFRAYCKPLKGIFDVTSIDILNKDVTLYEDNVWIGEYAIDEIELMQYTGFKDRDGIEIYEGDIVKDENENERLREVIWCLSDGAFYFSLIKQNNKPLIGIYRRELGCYEKGKGSGKSLCDANKAESPSECPGSERFCTTAAPGIRFPKHLCLM